MASSGSIGMFTSDQMSLFGCHLAGTKKVQQELARPGFIIGIVRKKLKLERMGGLCHLLFFSLERMHLGPCW